MPYGEKNRHSTDDVTFRAAYGIEAGVLAALENLDPTLPTRLAGFEGSRALSAGPGRPVDRPPGRGRDRAPKADGGYLQAEEYERLLEEAGDVRVIPLPEENGAVRTLLDGTYLQNIVFSKLRSIHSYRPAAVVAPLTGESFQVFFVAPQISYGVVGRLRAVLAASGLAGDERDTVRRLADEALDIPRIDARVRHSFPRGEGPPHMEDRPGLPRDSGFDPIAFCSMRRGRSHLKPRLPLRRSSSRRRMERGGDRGAGRVSSPPLRGELRGGSRGARDRRPRGAGV